MAFSRKSYFSSFIIKIAIGAVAISMAVMVISTAVVTGFKQKISDKVYHFLGHIHLNSFEAHHFLDEDSSISKNQAFIDDLENWPHFEHIQSYANKAGIIKTDETIEGLVFRGVGDDFNWSYFEDYLTIGKVIDTSSEKKSNDVIISEATARRLRLQVGDKILVYFVQEKSRYRKLTVSGLYSTGIVEFDQQFAFMDMRHIQKLNGWEEDEVAGFVVYLNDTRKIDLVSEILYQGIDNELNTKTVHQIFPNMFDWLKLQTTNEKIILALMMLVAVMNMSTALLILILERRTMIGILKAIGASDFSIRKIFVYKALLIVVAGLVLGNFLGLGICFLQYQFEWLRLPEDSYYLSIVPVQLSVLQLIYINLLTLIVCFVTLILPTFLISRISPAETIRFG